MRTERILEIQNLRLDQLFDQLEVMQGELTPEIEADLDMIMSDETALLDVVRMIQNMEASIETSKLWEHKRRERRKRKEAWANHLRALVCEAMRKREVSRLLDPETGDQVRRQKSKKLWYDTDNLPLEYLTPVTTYKVNTDKLREETAGGEAVVTEHGVVAKMEESEHIVIW